MNQANIEKFSCKICLEIAQEPVITPCGHLYCWTCIYEWKKKKESGVLTCPFCYNPIDIQKMTPIYTSEEKNENKPNDIPNRPQPERNPPPPQNEGIHRGANNFSFNVFGFPFLFGGFGFSFGNNNQNINRNSNIRAGGIMPSNFYIIFIMIALNVLLNFGPLFFGADYEYEEEEDRQYQKPKVRNANGRNFNKIHNENDSIWFLITMLFFFGIALLWKFLKKRY